MSALRSAGFPACGFWGHSCPQFQETQAAPTFNHTRKASESRSGTAFWSAGLQFSRRIGYVCPKRIHELKTPSMKRCFAVHIFALLAISAVSLAGDFRFFEPLNPRRPFQVMVHRGAAGQAPENTRPALQRCIED